MQLLDEDSYRLKESKLDFLPTNLFLEQVKKTKKSLGDDILKITEEAKKSKRKAYVLFTFNKNPEKIPEKRRRKIVKYFEEIEEFTEAFLFHSDHRLGW